MDLFILITLTLCTIVCGLFAAIAIQQYRKAETQEIANHRLSARIRELEQQAELAHQQQLCSDIEQKLIEQVRSSFTLDRTDRGPAQHPVVRFDSKTGLMGIY